MRRLGFLVQPRLDPRVSVATDSHFLQAVAHSSDALAGLLRVYDVPGDVVALGRYHLAPEPGRDLSGPYVLRRHSGGRVLPLGDGFVAFALTLPHRSALFSSNPLALAPHQVLNRYVRGILEGCKLAGVEAFYPGRDFITARGRVLGAVSFEVVRSGAMLIEGVLAVGRDFSVLPLMLDAVDPDGLIKADMLTAADATCLERELAATLTTEEVAEFLRRGFQDRLDVTLEPYALTPLEEAAINTAAHQLGEERWLRQRQLRPGLGCHAWTAVQLGVFEIFFALEQERFLGDVMLAGDFMANSPAIESLEHVLRMCPAEWQAVHTVVSDIFACPDNYILGIGDLRTISDTITKALGA
jgi:lipoate-protein ligase A